MTKHFGNIMRPNGSVLDYSNCILHGVTKLAYLTICFIVFKVIFQLFVNQLAFSYKQQPSYMHTDIIISYQIIDGTDYIKTV